ncbi:hypothetical protein F8154_03255 [Alkaliphilus pronyensis]|uniref:SCP domain-containing protein n=1 Tax=Alkaliphilus pronyensis TaxID=1482732 RepID=A0A6I0FA81_9FIRM|nr:CAP domain-containing protein [Alkaliphilus pronyensis]KAB3537322.1 hypothetical protein F8154_03255 [Alkaliphilus pronyensis]
MKKTLKKTISLAIISTIVIQSSCMVYASWGLQKYLNNRGEANPVNTTSPKDTTPPNSSTYNPSTTVKTPSNSKGFSSTADLIRSLRSNYVENKQGDQSTDTPIDTKPIEKEAEEPANNENSSSTIENYSSSVELMLELVNQERVKNGLNELELHQELTNVAHKKSVDIVENNYFSHTSPTYGSFYQMVYDAGISFTQVGENLAKARDVKKAHVLLMASTGHRANILNPNFTHIGLGIVKDKYGVVVTQLFIR